MSFDARIAMRIQSTIFETIIVIYFRSKVQFGLDVVFGRFVCVSTRLGRIQMDLIDGKVIRYVYVWNNICLFS